MTIQVLDVTTLDIVDSVTTDATQEYAFTVPELPPRFQSILRSNVQEQDIGPWHSISMR